MHTGIRINLQPSTFKAPYQYSSENKYVGSSRGIGIFTRPIVTNTKLNCVVTNLLFNFMLQKLSELHWQAWNAGDADISVTFSISFVY